jgi:flagellar biosynthesis protein
MTMDKGKKTERAVALLYDKTRAPAPQVVASGKGKIAEKILETARQAGIYIKEDPDLLELLAKVPTGEVIPVELYQAVAQILAFVYRVNNEYQNKQNVDTKQP